MNVTTARYLIATDLAGLSDAEVRLLDLWLMENGYEPSWSDRAGQPTRC